MVETVGIAGVVWTVAACTSSSGESDVAALPRFTSVQADVLSEGGSLTNAWADFDGDGDWDLFVGFNGADRLYRNDGGVLVDVAVPMGIVNDRSTRTSAWGDYDGDGDPDLFLGLVAGDAGAATALFRNDGDGFVEVTRDVGLHLSEGQTRQAAWVDYDGDGDLDLFLGLRDRANALFRNDEGRFSDVAADVGVADARHTVGAVWFDYEQDGDLDLIVANMDGDANGLFQNDGGRFGDVAERAGLADGGRGVGDPNYGSVRPCVVDYDADGRLDVFMANYGPNAFFHNQGDGTFRNVAEEVGVAIDARYDTCAFGDYDLDGRIDLYVNGTYSRDTQYRDYLFRQTGDGFEDVTPDNIWTLNADHGAQWIDFDRDGALDLSLTGYRPDGTHLVMRNVRGDDGSGRSIQVLVVDGEGRATRAGAEVRVYRAGTEELIGLQIVDAGSGYNSQNVAPVHFGLSGPARVDVEVVFPDGNRRVTVRESGVDPTATVGQPVTIRVQ